MKTKVLAITLDSYISRYDKLGDDKDNPYDFCPSQIYLDEAGYCSLIKGLTVLRKNIPVTLLGDHMQLPPVCEMPRKRIIEEHPRVFMWDQSLLYAEQLFAESNVACFEIYRDSQEPAFLKLKKSDLTETFRFGNELSMILDHYVYQNGFCSVSENNGFQIEVVNIRRESKDGKNHYNTAEVNWIASWINALPTSELGTYAVLTPYRKQVDLIKKSLKTFSDKQNVMTIHASQGREWDTVVFSVVDTDNKFFVDIHNTSVQALKLINTATSRSKKRLIIVCDVEYWKTQKNQFIYGLITNCFL